MQLPLHDRVIRLRQRVRCMKAVVNNKAPIIHVGDVARFTKLKEDVNTYIQRNKKNSVLLVRLNGIFRTRGVVDSFRTPSQLQLPASKNNYYKIKKLRKLEEENFYIGKKIMCAKAILKTHFEDHKKSSKTPDKFIYPEEVMSKYPKTMKIPSNIAILQKLLRPKIWLKLEIKNMRPLGVIDIELYTAAAPQVVLEFTKFCHDPLSKNALKFIRLFPKLWLEGEIAVDPKSISKKPLEYDMRTLDHTLNAGVLSFSKNFAKGFTKGRLNFSISFKTLPIFQCRRIAFGRIVHGLNVLNTLENFGTKNGKPTREIIVTNCGVYK